MAVVFWDTEGLVHLELFKSSKERPGLTCDLYSAMLSRMHASLTRSNPRKARRSLLLLQDNAPCHKTAQVAANLNSLGIKTMPHPPYSPDLAPSDYYLFRVIKNHFKGKSFGAESELESELRVFWVEEERLLFSWYQLVKT